MAFTKDTIFKKRISTKRGYEYTLLFVPGDIAFLTADEGSAAEFPHDVIFNEITLKENYNDDMPLGLPLGSVLSLKINLSAMENHASGDNWGDVRDWIIRGRSVSTLSLSSIPGYEGRECYIPNRWYIKRNTPGSPGEDCLIFEGIQERPKNIKLSGSGDLEITIAGMVRSLLGAVGLVDLKEYLDAVLPSYPGEPKWVRRQLHEYYGPFEYGRNYTCENPREDWEFKPNRDMPLKYYNCSLTGHIIKGIFKLAEYYAQAFRRKPLTDPDSAGYTRILNQVNGIFDIHSFYRKKDRDYFDRIDTQLTPDEIRVIYKVRQLDEDIGGLLVDSPDRSSWAREFNNAWNLLKILSECTLNKVRIENFKGSYYFIWQPVFSSYDWSGSLQQPLAIYRADLMKDIMFTYGTEYEQTVCTVGNIPSSGRSRFEFKNDGLGIDEGSLELVLKLHNQKLMPRDNWDGSKYDEKDCIPLDASYNQKMFYWSDMYEHDDYPEGMLIAVHDWCSIKINETNTVSSADIDNFPTLPLHTGAKQKYDLYKPWVLARNSVSGMGYTFAKAGNLAFNRKYQGFIEAEVFAEKVLPGFPGCMYSLDIGSLLPFTAQIPLQSPPGNCVLTSVEADLAIQTAKVKWFLRGDE